MTAGKRPSRRTERGGPLPRPLRARGASCLIAAMMMSFILSVAPCLQGCRNRREALAYRERWRSEQVRRRLAFVGSPRNALLGERNDDRRTGEERKVAHREGRARRGQGAGRAFMGRADRALPA